MQWICRLPTSSVFFSVISPPILESFDAYHWSCSIYAEFFEKPQLSCYKIGIYVVWVWMQCQYPVIINFQTWKLRWHGGGRGDFYQSRVRYIQPRSPPRCVLLRVLQFWHYHVYSMTHYLDSYYPCWKCLQELKPFHTSEYIYEDTILYKCKLDFCV